MIVVTTPTGQIGTQVLDKVLASDERIRVIVRDPSRLAAEARERVEVIQGAHDDPDVVTKAFAGVDTVFWVVPPNMRVHNIVDYYEGFSRPASAAIKARGVKRVVAVSSSVGSPAIWPSAPGTCRRRTRWTTCSRPRV